MKVAIVTAALFLLSYIAVNRGLGDNPAEIIVPMIVVLGFVGGVRWVRRRGRQKVSQSRDAIPKVDLDVIGDRNAQQPSKTPPVSRNRAKKLF